ncbi:NAD(P)-dependent oxidoreductase [Microbacterium sp. Mu-80]|uniref:NAD(P)-dependent oxidoreductase n=1 Tax=Microbacterium bandirmense TaxID=3122050 RepID=A0ABU8LGA1_9MICO
MNRTSIVMPDGDPLCERLFSDLDRAKRLDDLGGITVWTDAPVVDPRTVVERCAGAQAVVFGWPLPDEVLDLPDLKIVTFMGTGAANHVNMASARKRGIIVCNTPGYGDAAVAEHAIALMLSSLRSIPRYDRSMHAGRWDASTPAREVSSSTVGLVGFGGIARHVARVLSAMGARLLVATRTPERYRDAHPDVSFVSLEDLLRRSDIVSLHVALTPETAGMLDAGRLELLRPGTLLVNTARAELTDEARVAELVRNGRITAAIDVFSSEPTSEDHVFRGLDGAILTPHVGFNTPDAMERMADITVANLAGALTGQLVNRVA